MSRELSKLFITLGLDDKGLQASLNRAQKSIAGFGERMAVASGAVVGVVAGIGGAAIAAADEYDKATNIIRVGTGATGEDLAALEEDFKAIFGTIPASAEEIANALSNLNTLTGATGEELQKLTKNVLEASRMLGEDGTSNAQAFGQAMQQWNLPVEEGAGLLDKLFKITQDTGVGFGELLGKLNTYGPVLQNANFSTEEAAELFGKLTASGIDVSRVMPGLNKAFRDWAAEGKDGRKELNKTIEAIATAEDSSKALAIATGVFGAEGAQRMTTAIRNGTFSLDDLGISLENVEGLIQSTGEESKTMAEKMAEMKNQATKAIQPLGNALMPILEKMITAIKPIIEQIGKWISENPELTKTILLAAGAIGTLLLGLGTLMMLIGPIAAGFTILLGPVGLVVAAIIGLIAVGVLLWRNWDTISAKAAEMWGAIADFFHSVWERIKEIFAQAWAFIKNLFLKYHPVGILISHWEEVITWFQSFGDKIKEILSQAWEFIKNLFLEYHPVGMLISNWEEVVTFFQGIADRIKGIFTGLGENIKRALNAVLDFMRNFSWNFSGWDVAGLQIIPEFIFEPFKGLPKFSEGGILTKPTLGVYGDVPEAVIPLSKLGGMGANLTINIYPQNVIGSKEELARYIHETLLELQGSNVTLGFT